jgi:hypothetical protein
MEIKIENTAAVPATSIPESGDKEFHTRLMRYRLMLSLIDSMATRKIITQSEAGKLCTMAAQKSGLSSWSLFL